MHLNEEAIYMALYFGFLVLLSFVFVCLFVCDFLGEGVLGVVVLGGILLCFDFWHLGLD